MPNYNLNYTGAQVNEGIGKAMTALQEHQSLADYRTSAAQDIIDNAQSTSITNLQTAVQMNINQWDEMWEVGYIDPSTGQDASSSDYARSKGYIKANPSTTYYSYCNGANPCTILFYGSSKNFLSYASGRDREFTTPSNCAYIRFYTAIAKINDISINYPSSFTGYYPSALPKEIAERKDEDFMLAMDGFISPTINGIKNYWDGKLYHRRIARVDLGSLEWSYNGEGNLFYSSGVQGARSGGLAVYSKYNGVTGSSYFEGWGVYINAPTYHVTYINATGYTDELALKQALSGTFLYYELATEQTLNLDANGLRFELLWTNASPSSAFGQQTISLDLSNYRFVLIESTANTTLVRTVCTLIIPIGSDAYSNYVLDSNYSGYRFVQVRSNSVIFDNAFPSNTVVPYRIYGIR